MHRLKGDRLTGASVLGVLALVGTWSVGFALSPPADREQDEPAEDVRDGADAVNPACLLVARLDAAVADVREEIRERDGRVDWCQNSVAALAGAYWLDAPRRASQFDDDALEFARSYVAEFGAADGNSNPIRDAAWLFSVQPLSDPLVSAGKFTDRSREAEVVTHAFYRAFTERLLADPAARERYLWFAMYRDRPFHHSVRGGKIGYLETQVSTLRDDRGFGHDSDGVYFWRDAFAALVLMEATGRGDLLKNVKPAEMPALTARWSAWFDASKPHLEPRPDGLGWKMAENDGVQQPAGDGESQRRPLPPLLNPPQVPLPDWPDGITSPKACRLFSQI